MGGLKLADLTLDSRRVVYIHSLKALVCSDLHDALTISIASGLRDVVERIDTAILDYAPKELILLGGFTERSPISGVARRWGKKLRVHFVASNLGADAFAVAETVHCEVHKELIWGEYRLIENGGEQPELGLTTIVGRPNYSVRVGNRPLGGLQLVVFLKGPGRLIIPSSNPRALGQSIFSSETDRWDVFAVGHHRVLPMGKVADLRPYMNLVGTVPMTRQILGGNESVAAPRTRECPVHKDL